MTRFKFMKISKSGHSVCLQELKQRQEEERQKKEESKKKNRGSPHKIEINAEKDEILEDDGEEEETDQMLNNHKDH